MKKQQHRKVFALLFLLSITGAFNVLGDTDDYLIPEKEISKYKSWLKVTPKPHEVEFSVDGLAGG